MSEYLNRVWGFLKWHKKKFIALGTVTAVGVGGYYYAKRMLLDGMRQMEELGRGLQEKVMESQLRRDELQRIRQECGRMIATFIPPLRQMLKKLTDPKPITEKLKAIRSKEKGKTSLSAEDEESIKKLWNELKVFSLTRLIASVYALAMLNAVLRIQLHVLGRNAFEESSEHRRAVTRNATSALGGAGMEDKEGAEVRSVPPTPEDEEAELDDYEPAKITRKVRERFLFSGSDHLMNRGDGLHELIQFVHDSIDVATTRWVMGTDACVTRNEILDMMDAIRKRVESTPSPTNGMFLSDLARQWIVKCLIPQNEESILGPDRELDDTQNTLLKEMLEESFDMIESPMFAIAMQQSFDKLFEILQQNISKHPFSGCQSKDAGSAEEQLMLTKVFVSLKAFSGDVLSETVPISPDGVEESQYEKSLCDIPALDDLCSAIFQQGVDDNDGDNPLAALGLDSLGFGNDDLNSLTSLLGGDMSDDKLMKMLMSELGGAGGVGMPGDLGGEFDEQQLRNLFQSLAEGGQLQGMDQLLRQ